MAPRYVRGVPVDELVELEPDGTTGTLVRFRPSPGLAPVREGDLVDLPSAWPALQLTCVTAQR